MSLTDWLINLFYFSYRVLGNSTVYTYRSSIPKKFQTSTQVSPAYFVIWSVISYQNFNVE